MAVEMDQKLEMVERDERVEWVQRVQRGGTL